MKNIYILATLAMAILAVVLLVAAYWFFPGYSPSMPERKCAGFGNFNCENFVVNSSGGLVIVVK